MRGPGWSDNELLVALRSLAQRIGRTPREEDLLADPDAPKPMTYRRRFGSLMLAQQKAGLIPNENHGPKVYADSELKEKLRLLGQEVGHVPSSEDIRRHKNMPAYTTYFRRYGSMRKALDAAGIKYNPWRMTLRESVSRLMIKLREYLRTTKESWTARN